MERKRIAIVYDWMDSWGGVERMLLVLHEMFPEAEWYTSYVNTETAPWVSDLHKISTSFIQSLPTFIKNNRIRSLPLYSFAFENIDLRGYDLVISVSSSFAKSVITHPGTKHICILLTPTRWLWTQESRYLKEIPAFPPIRRAGAGMTFGKVGMTNFVMKPIINYLKKWDYVAAQRPDKIISISNVVADRCQKYYQRESEVLYPPFDFEYWKTFRSKRKSQLIPSKLDYYLIVSRLEPYKRVDLAIKAFSEFPNKQLVIVGKGTQASKLKKNAGQNIRFIHDVTDLELSQLYTHAEALIMPQEEDFGYVALEAQFFGCPVIAYGKGGATETVVKGKTGLFFSQQTARSLGDTVAHFERSKYNLGDSQVFLKEFSTKQFKNKLHLLIERERL